MKKKKTKKEKIQESGKIKGKKPKIAEKKLILSKKEIKSSDEKKIKKKMGEEKINEKEKHKIEKQVEKEVKEETKKILVGEKHGKKGRVFIAFVLAIVAGALFFIFTKKILNSVISFVAIIVIFFFYEYIRKSLLKTSRINKIESVFPDFLQLMSSNLRAGMTIDNAMLVSSREEFAPLDKEILQTGKDITTGKTIEVALTDMGKRINSDKINKTILLIISGIRAGGNLAVLLEETASNIRERQFVEKRAASNVMMYVIFIFVAVCVGAPLLFSLSNILVETLTNLLAGMPNVENVPTNVPFSLSGVEISITFIRYFSITFIIVIDILASLVLGLINKGEEKQGFKYLMPLLIISLAVFFSVRYLLSGFLENLF